MFWVSLTDNTSGQLNDLHKAIIYKKDNVCSAPEVLMRERTYYLFIIINFVLNQSALSLMPY